MFSVEVFLILYAHKKFYELSIVKYTIGIKNAIFKTY